MILADTGPLVALIDRDQGEIHDHCVQAYQELKAQPLLTTWSCLTEGMYFLHDLRGWAGQNVLFQFLEREALKLYFSDDFDRQQMAIMMERYQDVPMDFADASLVVAAQRTGIHKIFTLDSDFYVYCFNKMNNFQVIP